MLDHIHSVIERFPQNGAVVRSLIEEHPGFENLCREYALAQSELDNLAGDARPQAVHRAETLRKQHAMIEDEILTAIEGYSPT